MKMADGGYRPAYNVQYASDRASQMVVGVDVSTVGSDMAQLAPMVEQVEQRAGWAPEQWLVDGGFPAHERLDAVADKTEAYAPVPKPRLPRNKRDKGDDSDGGQGSKGSDTQAAAKAPEAGSEFEPKPGDTPAVVQWRQRMASTQAREIYKHRAATAECVNAQMRNHGLPRRGTPATRFVVVPQEIAVRGLALAAADKFVAA